MKFPSPILVACGLALALGWSACDSQGPSDTPSGTDRVGDSGEGRRPGSTPGADGGLDGIRARAEAAFEDPSIQPERFETRVGPQPWPRDLPSNWPRPATGRVVADSKRAGGERLLLIDLPGSADEALATYRRALRNEDFEVEESSPDGSKRGLRVRRGRDEASLRFFDRDHRTRIEILFLARSGS